MDRGAWVGYSLWGLRDLDMTTGMLRVCGTHTHTHRESSISSSSTAAWLGSYLPRETGNRSTNSLQERL